MKEIKDTIKYLEHIENLSKTLPKDKKDELRNIISVLLTLLVSLKQSSKLGTYKFTWE